MTTKPIFRAFFIWIYAFVWTAFFLLSESAIAQNTNDGSVSYEELKESINAVFQESMLPGLAILIIENDMITMEHYSGFADLSTQQLVNRKTLFRAGSISKSIIGLMTVIQVESGLLSLDNKLHDIAPNIVFENNYAETHPITIAHLLEHTSGFPDLVAADYFVNQPEITLKASIQRAQERRRARWKPGTFQSYSNDGAAVAALVLEIIGGLPFEKQVEEQIFRPLGMTSASYILNNSVRSDLATGYAEDGRTPVPYAHIIDRPAGALNIQPFQLTQLVRLMLNRGTIDKYRLVQKKNIQRMERGETSLAYRAGVDTVYGLGIDSFRSGSAYFRGHDGAIDGYLSVYGYNPAYNTGFVIMANGWDFSGFDTIQNIIMKFLVRTPVPPVLNTKERPHRRQFSEYEGYYTLATSRSPFDQLVQPFTQLKKVTISETGMKFRGEEFNLDKTGVGRSSNAGFKSLALVSVDGNSYVVGNQYAYKQISPTYILVRNSLFIAASLASALIFCWLTKQFLRFIQRRPRKPLELLPQSYSYVAATVTIVFFICVWIFIRVIETTTKGFELSATINPATSLILVLSYSVAFFALSSPFVTIFCSNGMSTTKKTRRLLVSAILLAVVLTLTPFGWFPLRMWML